MRRTLLSRSLLLLCQSAMQSVAESFAHRIGLPMTPLAVKHQTFVLRRDEPIPQLHYRESAQVLHTSFKREPRGGQALVRREMRITKPIRSSRRNGSRK